MIVKIVHTLNGKPEPAHTEWVGGVERVEQGDGTCDSVDYAVRECFSSVRYIGNSPWRVVWAHFGQDGKLPAFIGYGADVGVWLMSDMGNTVDRVSP